MIDPEKFAAVAGLAAIASTYLFNFSDEFDQIINEEEKEGFYEMCINDFKIAKDSAVASLLYDGEIQKAFDFIDSCDVITKCLKDRTAHKVLVVRPCFANDQWEYETIFLQEEPA